MAMEILSREEARVQGHKQYFTGKPCNKGHVSKRYVSTYQCVEFLKLSTAQWRSKPSNMQHMRDQWHIYREKHPERVKASRDAWRAANEGRLKELQQRRRAAKTRQTPKWGDRAAMIEIYAQARSLTKLTGIEFHVDHVVPLQGRRVRGLHVEHNLQILTKYENQKKLNRFDDYYGNEQDV